MEPDRVGVDIPGEHVQIAIAVEIAQVDGHRQGISEPLATIIERAPAALNRSAKLPNVWGSCMLAGEILDACRDRRLNQLARMKVGRWGQGNRVAGNGNRIGWVPSRSRLHAMHDECLIRHTGRGNLLTEGGRNISLRGCNMTGGGRDGSDHPQWRPRALNGKIIRAFVWIVAEDHHGRRAEACSGSLEPDVEGRGLGEDPGGGQGRDGEVGGMIPHNLHQRAAGQVEDPIIDVLNREGVRDVRADRVEAAEVRAVGRGGRGVPVRDEVVHGRVPHLDVRGEGGAGSLDGKVVRVLVRIVVVDRDRGVAHAPRAGVELDVEAGGRARGYPGGGQRRDGEVAGVGAADHDGRHTGEVQKGVAQVFDDKRMGRRRRDPAHLYVAEMGKVLKAGCVVVIGNVRVQGRHAGVTLHVYVRHGIVILVGH